MTTIQPTEPATYIAVSATDVQKRVSAFQRELDLAKRELLLTKQDINVLALKLTACRTLLQRVIEVDEVCSGEAYAALIADVKAALEVQS